MAASTYKTFIDRMISRYEGGYGWNRKDPGGPTKYGVTCWDLAEHRKFKMDSMARWAPIVQAMTIDEAEAIYATKYAAAIRYNDLPAGVDTCIMDYAVNSGVSRALLVAHTMLGLPASGHMDQALLDKINATDPAWFVKTMCAERLQFMHAIRGGEAWIEFGAGWYARVCDLQSYGLHLIEGIDGSKINAPDLTKVVQPKAIHVTKTAPKSTTAGAVAAGVATHTAGLPLWATASAIIGVFVIGVLYEAYQDTKTNAANLHVVFAR